MKQADFEELLESVREGGNLAIVGGPLDKGFAGAVWIYGLVPPRRHAVKH